LGYIPAEIVGKAVSDLRLPLFFAHIRLYWLLLLNSNDKTVDIKDIKAIIDLMRKNSVSEFELEKQDFKIRLKRGSNGTTSSTSYEDAPMVGYQQAAVLPSTVSSPMPQLVINEVDIKSPMIGTFYRAPSPESASYVEVGTDVNPDTVVCIIEAMKVMNEIKAEAKGIITQVMVENAKPVEFGQPLFKIRPS
jgi:acetyl-CoA carboxylase biotin carboxyl carrier protein